uniref:tumor necrosis factor receptor superfamily member 14-like isoform X2 n=1 Tax=Scatophagus argus TaxID=75038 RepID=UPI001ED7CF05|nr:tumor necrosis factor receptor superfamily member 14-like isoform X2 [Scatophagus argus]
MSSMLIVFGSIAVFTMSGLCCRPNEYETTSGECCPRCLEGTFVRRDCTLQSGTRCGRCENGTFMSKPNGLNRCFPCSSCQQSYGLFVKQECTTIHDTVCDVLSGYFCKSLTEDTGCGLAEKHTHCVPGQRIKEAGTSRADTVCEDCQSGFFSQDGVNCTAWKTCTETQSKVKEGSTSTDVVCGSASRNHYCYIPLLLLLLTVSGIVIEATVICCSTKR